MKQKVMDAMQSFSKALMGPVLFLPIAGMLQAISSVMSNTALVTEGGVVWTLGKFINAGLVIAISKSGKTDTILKPVQDSFAQHRSIIAFVGADNSPIARCADPAFVLLDDKMLDDRNLTANYFYARVLITFEYLMDLVLEKDEHPNGKEGQ